MLGNEISDPSGIEGKPGKSKGFAFLNIKTVIAKSKKLTQVKGKLTANLPFCKKGTPFEGYEIHMGKTYGSKKNILEIEKNKKTENIAVISDDNRVFGTYIHGFFDSDEISTGLLKWLAEKSGKKLTKFHNTKNTNFENFTQILKSKIKNSQILK